MSLLGSRGKPSERGRRGGGSRMRKEIDIKQGKRERKGERRDGEGGREEGRGGKKRA